MDNRNINGRFIKGYLPPTHFIKGHKMSEKTKIKIGLFWKGKKREPFTLDHKKKIGEAKRGCTAWNKGKKMPPMSEKIKKKMGEAARRGENHPQWKGGKPLCVICKKRLSHYKSKYCIEHRFTLKQPTSIEKKLYEELKKRGLLFETQKLIGGKFTVDAYIPSLNLIIEADGDYWHSLPKVIRNDKYKNICLKNWGYKLLRLSETEINSDNFINKLN